MSSVRSFKLWHVPEWSVAFPNPMPFEVRLEVPDGGCGRNSLWCQRFEQHSATGAFRDEGEPYGFFEALSDSIERSSGNRPEALQRLAKDPGTVSATGDASEKRQL